MLEVSSLEPLGEFMTKGHKLACLALAVLVAAGMRAQDDARKNAAEAAKAMPAEQPSPSNVPADYVIGADDTLHVSVWKEPDLSGTLPVRPDGKISLPLLNDIQAKGMTPMQLADSITEKLRKYVSDPHVTVV